MTKRLSLPVAILLAAALAAGAAGAQTTINQGHDGGAPGRVAEFDARLNLIKEWPENPPLDGFNPHGTSVRPDRNLMVTSDFILPSSTLNVNPGAPVLRGAPFACGISRTGRSSAPSSRGR
jgi:hypothetical protein